MAIKSFSLEACRNMANSWFVRGGDAFYLFATPMNKPKRDKATEWLDLIDGGDRVSSFVDKVSIESDGSSVTLRFYIIPERKEHILKRRCFRIKAKCEYYTEDNTKKESVFESIFANAYLDIADIEEKYGLDMFNDTRLMLVSMLAIALYNGSGLDYEEGEDDARQENV